MLKPMVFFSSGRCCYLVWHRGYSRYMYQQDTDTHQVQDPDTEPDPHPDQDQSQERKKKWVINLPDVPLTPTQEAVLAHMPNFAVTPKNLPIVEYITSLEVASQKLNTNTAEELRSEVFRVLRHSHPPKPNLKREEKRH